MNYSLQKCLNWGVSYQHLSLVSKSWQKRTYGKAIQHLLVGLVEAIPVVGQIISLAECCFVKMLMGVVLDKNILSSSVQAKILSMQPQVVESAWGKIVLFWNGQRTQYKDVVILPSKGKQGRFMEWNWGRLDPKMRHSPGIRMADIQHWMEVPMQGEILPDAVILTRGRGHGGGLDNSGEGVLEIDPGTKPYLIKNGIKEEQIYILKTEPALQKYKELCEQGKRVVAFIHTTC